MRERVHGGLPVGELRDLGLDASRIIDFSVNCNPYGPCPEVLRAIREAPLDRYPDPAANEAREAIAAMLDLAPGAIALGNGAAELLWAIAHVFVCAGTDIVIAEPTFCEFRAAAERNGGRVHEWPARAEDGFAIDLGAIGQLIRERSASVVYLCVPNTPTGAACPARAIRAFAADHPAVTIVLDQSFLSLSERFSDAGVRMPDNVVAVRSLTKDHAIPGIRVGYLVAAPKIVAEIERSRPAWPTSSQAQAAATAACAALDFVATSRATLLADRARLGDMLAGLGLATVPSTTGFLIVRTGDGAALRRRLLARHQILVRDCASFGLPDFVRLAARPEPERARLAVALREEVCR